MFSHIISGLWRIQRAALITCLYPYQLANMASKENTFCSSMPLYKSRKAPIVAFSSLRFDGGFESLALR